MKSSTVKSLDPQHNAKVAEALNKFLASSYMLYQKSLYYHWNVTGEQFVSLHQLFMQHYTELQTAIDDIAERIRSIGHQTPGTLADFIRLSSLSEDKSLPSEAQNMVKNLLKDHETCAQQAKGALALAQEAGDEVTTDLMVQRMTVHEKTAWMLRAMLA